MVVQVKHAKVSAAPEGADASKVRTSDWNDDHVVTGAVEGITADQTIPVGPGEDFTTIAAALASIADKYIAASAVVTIQLPAGSHDEGATIVLDRNDGRIALAGQARTAVTVTNIVSVSAYVANTPRSVVLDVASAAAVSVGDLLAFQDAIAGVGKVTAKATNRLTVALPCRGTPPGVGAFSATAWVYSTRVLNDVQIAGRLAGFSGIGVVDAALSVSGAGSVPAGMFDAAVHHSTDLDTSAIYVDAADFSGAELYIGTVGGAGFNANGGARVDFSGSVSADGNGVIAAGRAYVGCSAVVGACSVGVNAYAGGFIGAWDTTFIGNVADTSPAPNVVGSQGEFIGL